MCIRDSGVSRAAEDAFSALLAAEKQGLLQDGGIISHDGQQYFFLKNPYGTGGTDLPQVACWNVTELSQAEQEKELLEQADSLLMMPDLFNYYLSGGKCCEYSIASTTQMLDAVKKNWSDEVIEKLGLPARRCV